MPIERKSQQDAWGKGASQPVLFLWAPPLEHARRLSEGSAKSTTAPPSAVPFAAPLATLPAARAVFAFGKVHLTLNTGLSPDPLLEVSLLVGYMETPAKPTKTTKNLRGPDGESPRIGGLVDWTLDILRAPQRFSPGCHRQTSFCGAEGDTPAQAEAPKPVQKHVGI